MLDLNDECTPPATPTANANDSVNINPTEQESFSTNGPARQRRDAVAEFLQYLESRPSLFLFPRHVPPDRTTLSFSDNAFLQRNAAFAFAEITEKEIRLVGRDVLNPIVVLLSRTQCVQNAKT